MGKHKEPYYPNDIGSILNWAILKPSERIKKELPLNMEKAFGRLCGVRTLNWGGYTDAIYSFLSLYSLGIKSYNPQIIDVKEVKVGFRTGRIDLIFNNSAEENLKNKIVWNSKQILDLNNNSSIYITKLNQNVELIKFAKRYFTIGNIMPIWPNGNEGKGKQENLFFDIPELYYKVNNTWFEFMKKLFPNAFLDDIKNEVLGIDYNNGLKSFFDCFNDEKSYTNYLKHVNTVIESRTLAIENWLIENKKCDIKKTRLSGWD